MRDEREFPGPRCFRAAFEFLDLNRAADDWFLMVECFDPHEPFFAPERFKEQYRTGWNGGVLDWPYYEKANDSSEEIAEIRANYAALVAMCDDYCGKLLDYLTRTTSGATPHSFYPPITATFSPSTTGGARTSCPTMPRFRTSP
jgi:Sulfatase